MTTESLNGLDKCFFLPRIKKHLSRPFKDSVVMCRLDRSALLRVYPRSSECFERIATNRTIPQDKAAYTKRATSVAGSNTAVVTAPWAVAVGNIPKKGNVKRRVTA